MNEEKKSKKLYYIIIGIALTLVLGIGVSFAVFTAQANRNANLVTTGNLQIRYTEGSTITADNLKPATVEQVKEAYTHGSCIFEGDRVSGLPTEKICAYKTFTITNIGSLTAYTTVMVEDVTNTYQNLKYQLFETTPETLSGINLLNTTELVNNIELLPNGNKTYTLLIWLDESATIETDQNKSYTAKITASAITTTNKNLDESGANAPVLADGMIPISYVQCSEIDSPLYGNGKNFRCYRENINDTDKSGLKNFCVDLGRSTKECEDIIDELLTNGAVVVDGNSITLIDFITMYESFGYTMTSNFQSCNESSALSYETYPMCYIKTYSLNDTDMAGIVDFCVNYIEGATTEQCQEEFTYLSTSDDIDEIKGFNAMIVFYQSLGNTMTSPFRYVYDETIEGNYIADSYNVYKPYKWYDYDNQKWANAIMVKTISENYATLSDGTPCTGTNGYCTREDYMNASNGVIIPEEDILAYYVWIPRYKYQLFNVDFASVSKQFINVQFERGIASTGNVRCSTSEIGVETCTNKANGNWYTHPAFTFGEEELQGIWVGKFETGYGTNTSGYPDNTVYEIPTIKPNVMSLVNQQVSKQFETAQYFGTSAYLTNTGVNEVDAHMMKNIEWGAVAYLKQSIFGSWTTNIGLNSYFLYQYPNYKFLTGCGPQSEGDEGFGDICNAYNTTLGMSASTTGNITGIYDMSGGTPENVMGVMQDNTTTGRSPMSGYSTVENSGYIGKVGSSYADSNNTLAFPNAKYYDLYANGTSSIVYTGSHLGDATGETRGWYNDFAYFLEDAHPWFSRGGFYNNSSGMFCFEISNGNADDNEGFRSVLAVNK